MTDLTSATPLKTTALDLDNYDYEHPYSEIGHDARMAHVLKAAHEAALVVIEGQRKEIEQHRAIARGAEIQLATLRPKLADCEAALRKAEKAERDVADFVCLLIGSHDRYAEFVANPVDAQDVAIAKMKEAEKRAEQAEADANRLRDTLDNLGAAAEKIYGYSGDRWQFVEALSRLVDDVREAKEAGRIRVGRTFGEMQ